MATEKHLIYKEDLLETVLDHFGVDLAYLGEDLQFCQEAIDLAPTVDAAPVVHGHWIADTVEAFCPLTGNPYPLDVLQCSACGGYCDVSEARNYCPNCGAKMDEEV